jgi:hypothetical protein
VVVADAVTLLLTLPILWIKLRRGEGARLRTHGPSQKLAVAARVMAPRKMVGQRS